MENIKLKCGLKIQIHGPIGQSRLDEDAGSSPVGSDFLVHI